MRRNACPPDGRCGICALHVDALATTPAKAVRYHVHGVTGSPITDSLVGQRMSFSSKVEGLDSVVDDLVEVFWVDEGLMGETGMGQRLALVGEAREHPVPAVLHRRRQKRSGEPVDSLLLHRHGPRCNARPLGIDPAPDEVAATMPHCMRAHRRPARSGVWSSCPGSEEAHGPDPPRHDPRPAPGPSAPPSAHNQRIVHPTYRAAARTLRLCALRRLHPWLA
jgi:hypothetical protein